MQAGRARLRKPGWPAAPRRSTTELDGLRGGSDGDEEGVKRGAVIAPRPFGQIDEIARRWMTIATPSANGYSCIKDLTVALWARFECVEATPSGNGGHSPHPF